MLKNKGQITIFIIIGILALIAIGVFLFVRQITIEKTIGPETLKEITKESTGQKALKNYVDACLRPAVLQGLEIQRLQGGYIEIPSDAKYLLAKDINHEQVTKENGRLKVIADENGVGNKIPYWLTEEEMIFPDLEFMEYELENYVKEGVEICVGDFSPFKEQGFDVEYGDITPRITMKNTVIVEVDFPITMTKENLIIKLDKFIYEVPIDMELIHNMADDLTTFESLFTYLESFTISLISLYSGLEDNLLPPFDQIDFNLDCKEHSWDKGNVKSMLKNNFEKNYPYLKIKGTNFEREIRDDPIAQGAFDSFIYNIFSSSFPTLHIDFTYDPDWEFNYYDIKPSYGNTLKPKKTMQTKFPFIPMMCEMRYRFFYYLKYPVLVNVNDDKSAKIDPLSNTYDKEGGYVFQFPMEVYLSGNNKRYYVGEPPSIDCLDAGLNASVCATVLSKTYFCDEEQKKSGNITIKTYDLETNKKLGDVDIYYYCGSYKDDCFIGRTVNGTFKTKFPFCENGVVHLRRNNYSTKTGTLTINSLNPRVLEYNLAPLKTFNASVKKYIMDDPDICCGNAVDLDSFDSVIILIKKIKENSLEEDFSNTILLNKEINTTEIKLMPGKYTINAMLIDGKGFHIPAGCKEYCHEYDDDGECEEYDYLPKQDINANQSTLGGALFGETNYFVITDDDMTKDNIEFNVVRVPTPTCIDAATGDDERCMIGKCVSMEELGKVEKYTSMFRNYLLPKIK
ncbi:MAG: hypothetical protein KAU20_02925 [Nanoarchaeota archaeon]|nr:hypothetical protein [Nanoarchaeota archaeon]